MCISFFYIPDPTSSSPYKLVLAMNRDEYFRRPTLSARWKDGLLGGWDCQIGREGGTWLAMDRSGRIAFLTNVFTAINPDARGRGSLVVDYLKGASSPAAYLGNTFKEMNEYNPFNLVLLEPNQEGYSAWKTGSGLSSLATNHPPQQIKCGVHGVSNHPLKSQFSKSKLGEEALRQIVDNCIDENDLLEKLEELLTNKSENWPDPQLIAQCGSLREDSPFARLGPNMSSTFVNIPHLGYGTRTHTMILVDKNMNVTYKEVTRGEAGDWTEARETFKAETS